MIQMAAGEGVRFPKAGNISGVLHLAACSPGAGAEIDDVVGDLDDLRLVLDHQNGVPLVAQPAQQPIRTGDVVRVQSGRRLVEDIGDVRERGAEVADHLRALRLPARQRSRRPVEREVAEADVDERVDRLTQRGQQRRDGGIVDRPQPGGEVGDLHRRRLGDVDVADP